jgi:Xaa-Pro dipeptidase
MNLTSLRIKRVFQNIEDEIPDAILVKNSVDPHLDRTFLYFSDLASGLFEESIFLAHSDGTALLYTSNLEESSAKEGSSRFETVLYANTGELENHLKDLNSSIDNLGINSRDLTYRDFLFLKRSLPKVKLLDVGKAIKKTRLVKDEEEIERMRISADISCKIFDTILPILKAGIFESEVKAQICYQIRRKSSNLAFEPIVSFGENSAEPHYFGGKGKLKNGDFILLDYGACFRGYNTDISRTISSGRVSNDHLRLYNAVYDANIMGIDSVKAGISASDVHKKVTKSLDSKGLADKFIHSTGHSIGLSVHDGATINDRSNLILEEGMVFTIEPGVYVSGLGGVRIEDDVIVRKSGVEILTPITKELLNV